MNPKQLTKIGRELESNLIAIDILHENYTCTIDTPSLTKSEREKLKIQGYEITHERDTIYTLKKKL